LKNGADHARLTVVIFAAGLLVFGISSLALIILELHEAPEGYEDERGFHVVRNIMAGFGVSGLVIRNINKTGSFPVLRSRLIVTGFP
jgi:hypothetical protein